MFQSASVTAHAPVPRPNTVKPESILRAFADFASNPRSLVMRDFFAYVVFVRCKPSHKILLSRLKNVPSPSRSIFYLSDQPRTIGLYPLHLSYARFLL